jgi:chorismate-pyruvate lyase
MVELSTLIDLFYTRPAELARLTEVSAGEMPPPYRELLDHQHHMTVTVEAHHRSPVDVRVLERKSDRNFYSRKILLARQTDGRVVQFGIMRVNFEYLSPAVRREIESEKTPLGRVLISHNVLREIELVSLWKVEPGPDLCELFNILPHQSTYGRTAIIHCNGEPGVELLEIVTPEE